MGADLARRTTGLTSAHVALIHLLAAEAVELFLAESETVPTDAPADVTSEAKEQVS